MARVDEVELGGWSHRECYVQVNGWRTTLYNAACAAIVTDVKVDSEWRSVG